MQCHQCGYQLPLWAKFCRNCGANQVQMTYSEPSVKQQPAPISSQPQLVEQISTVAPHLHKHVEAERDERSVELSKSSFTLRFAVISMVVVALVGGGYWVGTQKKATDENSQQLVQNQVYENKHKTVKETEEKAQKEMQEKSTGVVSTNANTASINNVNSQHVSPSFDCSKARSTVENLICNDSELSSFDFELSKIYQRAKIKATDQNVFKKQNVAEWKWREANCQTKECLTEWYARRKAQLLQLAD